MISAAGAGAALPDWVPLKDRVGKFEKDLILAALEKTDWNQKKAADLLRSIPPP